MEIDRETEAQKNSLAQGYKLVLGIQDSKIRKSDQ